MGLAEALRQRYESRTPGLLGATKGYAVLCPLVEMEDGTHILFEVRAQNVRQGGEVCFPGGKVEGNESAEECALRETEEELGIPCREVTLLGKSDFLCGRGNFLLQPVLGQVSAAGFDAICPSGEEVAEVFTVPAAFFRDTAPEVYTYALRADVPEDFPYEAVGISRDYPWREGRVEVPVWHYEGHVIWGMTARILKDIFR